MTDEPERSKVDLHQGEENFHNIFAHAPIGQATVSLDFRFMQVNQAACQISGYEEQELIGQKVHLVIHPDDLELAIKLLSPLFSGEASHVQIDHRGLRKDHRVTNLMIFATMVRNSENEPMYMVALVQDITKRKRAEEEIRLRQKVTHAIAEAEDLYYALQGVVQSLCEATQWVLCQIWIPKPESGALECSSVWYSSVPGLEKFRELSRRTTFPPGIGLPGRVWSSKQPAWIRDVTQETNFPRAPVAKEVGLKGAVAFPILAKDEVVAIIEFFVFEEREEDERFVQLISTVSSEIGLIVQRRQAKQALRQSEERFRAVAQSAVDGVVLADDSGNIVFWNKTAQDLFGYDIQEVLGKSLTVLMPERYKPLHLSGLERFKATGEARVIGKMVEVHGRKKDGSEFPLEISLANWKIAKQNFFSAFLRDITERKRAEEKLIQTTSELNSIFEAFPDLYFRLDSDGTILNYYAGRSSDLYAPPEAFLGKRPIDVLPGDAGAQIQNAVDEVLRTKSAVSIDYALPMPHGDQNFEARFIPFSEKQVVCSIRNITKQKQAEEEKAQLEKELREAQKMDAIGKLAGGVAHDYNNTLMAIISYCELMMMKIRPNDALRQDILEIQKAADQGVALTRQLLAFSRKQVLQTKILDLNTVLYNMQGMLRSFTGEHIELNIVTDPQLGLIRVDPSQMEQIIVNLVVNARDAMPDGGKLTIETKNVILDKDYVREHIVVTPGPYVLMAITDTESGIDPATKLRIFEPFFTTKEAGKGTGLGLSTVYGIVKQSNGYIWVYSEQGSGSTFKIYLPMNEDILAKESTIPESIVLPFVGSETILLVDDNEFIGKAVRASLEMRGYTVLQANSAKAALEIEENQCGPIHLLITDVAMPAVSGSELAELLQHRRPDVRVLFMSGYTEEAVIRQGTLKSGRAFVSKPVSMETLLRTARELLDNE